MAGWGERARGVRGRETRDAVRRCDGERREGAGLHQGLKWLVGGMWLVNDLYGKLSSITPPDR